ncbi:MAG: hypothetical protein WBP22_00155 [Candidatus Saccharimonas sp.]|jgi:hypothetical protein
MSLPARSRHQMLGMLTSPNISWLANLGFTIGSVINFGSQSTTKSGPSLETAYAETRVICYDECSLAGYVIIEEADIKMETHSNGREERRQQLISDAAKSNLADAYTRYQQVAALVPQPMVVNTAPVRYSTHTKI